MSYGKAALWISSTAGAKPCLYGYTAGLSLYQSSRSFLTTKVAKITKFEENFIRKMIRILRGLRVLRGEMFSSLSALFSYGNELLRPFGLESDL